VSSLKGKSVDKPHPVPSPEPTVYETGTAVSPDLPMQVDATEFRSTPSPYPRGAEPIPWLRGYIPGMLRPMTSSETTFDPDEVSPSSSPTPRATSPRTPSTDRTTSPSNILHRDSTSVQHSHRTSSPLPSAPLTSLLSGVSDRSTPDRSHTPDGPSLAFGSRKYRKQSNYRRTYLRKSSVPRPDWDLLDTDSDSAVENDDGRNNYEERFFDVDSGSYNAPCSVKTMSKQSFSIYSLASTTNSGTSTIFYDC